MKPAREKGDRGSALLLVLWLSAILAVLALSLGTSVRSDADRASATANGLRAYYLATGSIDRALLHLHWEATQTVPRSLHFSYPTGDAEVRLIPEKEKQDVNTISPDAMLHLLNAVGAPTGSARRIVEARFTPGHPSINDLEELLSVSGVTPELYFGHTTDANGKPTWQKGLRDYLTATASDAVFTVVATGHVDSAHRSVGALVRLEPTGNDPFYRVLRWYDDAATMTVQ